MTAASFQGKWVKSASAAPCGAHRKGIAETPTPTISLRRASLQDVESDKSRSKWLPCERFVWNACARGDGDSLEWVVRLGFWFEGVSSSAGFVMAMTMTATAASQPTEELRTVSCWGRAAQVETKAIPYRSILTADESRRDVCIWRGR